MSGFRPEIVSADSSPQTFPQGGFSMENRRLGIIWQNGGGDGDSKKLVGPNREIDWPEPTINQAIIAGMAIGHHYGAAFSKIDVREHIEYQHLTYQEAKQKLLELANHIMDGTVNSHVDIAKVVRSLGPLMGPLGSASTEIDLAAFRVAYAVFQRQKTFQEAK
ncbi:hypothetical protein HY029_01680 [Candidatus Gottesmanbacteria bacterium]|nr:hypothetical protein [Candidatus Gottesmanbacteria bacterium]